MREGISMAQAISRMQGNTEASEPEQPSVEPVDVSSETQDAPEETIDNEFIESSEEVEVSEGGELADGVESVDVEEESLFVEIDGEEINLNDIKEWRSGHMKNADYTQKTQALAEQRKTVEAKHAQFDELNKVLETSIEGLKSLIDEQNESVDWDYLRDTDTSEYLKQKEASESKLLKLKEAEAQKAAIAQAQKAERVQAEQELLLKALPSWQDQKQRESDIKLIQSYVDANNYTADDTGNIVDHRHWLALLDAAKYRELQEKGASISKKVKKAPKVIKPSKSTAKATGVDAELKKAQARLKQTGSLKDAHVVQQLKKQLRGN